MGSIIKRVSQGAVLPVIERIKAETEALRAFVDNLNQAPDMALRGGIYRPLSKADVFTSRIDGWEIGYMLKPQPMDYFKRSVFLKVHGATLAEVGEAEFREVFSTVLQIALDVGFPTTVEQIAPDCVRVDQFFQVMFMKEQNPNLIVPGNPASRST